MTVLVSRKPGLLREAAESVRARGGEAVEVAGDVGEAATLRSAVEACVQVYGGLDVLINNAGSGLFASIGETQESDLDLMWRSNVKGVFFGVQAALPVMRRQGHGHIINVASTAGRRGSPYVSAYCASKFAVVGLTESLRTELLGSGIHVSLVCPGATRTSFFDAAIRRTDRHEGLVGPVESAEAVARRIVKLIRHPQAVDVAQPIRRKLFFILNILAPSLVDRLLARMLGVSAQGRSSA
jgi:NAD(P)-dependent dehydrogenase (short-subunit alcohol dehydrogenase family)